MPKGPKGENRQGQSVLIIAGAVALGHALPDLYRGRHFRMREAGICHNLVPHLLVRQVEAHGCLNKCIYA